MQISNVSYSRSSEHIWAIAIHFAVHSPASALSFWVLSIHSSIYGDVTAALGKSARAKWKEKEWVKERTWEQGSGTSRGPLLCFSSTNFYLHVYYAAPLATWLHPEQPGPHECEHLIYGAESNIWISRLRDINSCGTTFILQLVCDLSCAVEILETHQLWSGTLLNSKVGICPVLGRCVQVKVLDCGS